LAFGAIGRKVVEAKPRETVGLNADLSVIMVDIGRGKAQSADETVAWAVCRT